MPAVFYMVTHFDFNLIFYILPQLLWVLKYGGIKAARSRLAARQNPEIYPEKILEQGFFILLAFFQPGFGLETAKRHFEPMVKSKKVKAMG